MKPKYDQHILDEPEQEEFNKVNEKVDDLNELIKIILKDKRG